MGADYWGDTKAGPVEICPGWALPAGDNPRFGEPELMREVFSRSASLPIRSVLAAIDLSSSSLAVLSTARRLAQCDGSAIRVVYSMEPFRHLGHEVTLRDGRFHPEVDRRRFERMVRSANLSRLWDTTILCGHAGRAMLREAREGNVDLIVMGVRRHGTLFPKRFGRTTRYVLRHWERSVVVVPS
ncbi:universal stress protein [Gemmatimonadota bacterium]